MKFFFALSFIFATFLVAQAQNLKLNIIVSDDKIGGFVLDGINGQLSVKLEGATETKDVVFPKKEIFRFERFETNTDFSEVIEKATISWKSDKRGSNIKIGTLVIISENEVLKFETTKKYIEDGETIVLHKA